MFDFLRALISFFEQYNVPYMLSGSVAMSLYTQPRFTRDYDFIVHLKTEDIEKLKEYFKEGYYCSEEAVTEAVNKKGMFNIIDFKSGYKADFVILKDQPFRKIEFERKRKLNFLDMEIFVVSAEDLLLSKIIWIQELQSGQQMEDIKSLAQINGLDWKYIRQWISELGLKTFNLLP
jgi:hypothetical protein